MKYVKSKLAHPQSIRYVGHQREADTSFLKSTR